MIVINRFFINFILLITTLSHAERPKCVENSMVFNDILGCYLNAYDEVDKKLNKIYKQKMSVLSEKKKENLKESEQNWIQLKNNLCVVDEIGAGRESHFDAIQCEIDLTKERIEFIKSFK